MPPSLRLTLLSGLVVASSACGPGPQMGPPPTAGGGTLLNLGGGGFESGGGFVTAGGDAGGAGGGTSAAGGSASAGGSAQGGGAASSGGVAGGGRVGGGSVGGGSTAGGSTAGGAASCGTPGATRSEEVCRRWRCDRASRSEGTWNGNVTGCMAGMLDPAAAQNALRLLNLYRFIADLPAVTLDATKSQAAQECALMMDANNALSHTPPTNWLCYTANGATAAGRSNISTGRAVVSIDMYMSDYGNATTIGHRRWFLSNSLGPVGIGGTTGASCHHVIGGTGAANKPWMAWPPQGPVPLEAIAIPGQPSIDSTGWTVQSSSSAYNLTNATVTVTDNGTNKPVTTTTLGQNYGSTYAIRFNPMGWTTQAGHSYQVSVTGPSLTTPITYTVDVVACP